jgi:arginyl-tRNA synthetase
MKPRDIAEALARKLSADPRIASAEVAGPGFLNLRLTPEAWRGVIAAILEQGAAYGRSGTLGQGRRVNVEYRLGQPHRADACGPYTRGAVFGDAWPAFWPSPAMR